MRTHTYLPLNRKRYALLVEELAKLLGVDHAVVSRLEAGERSPHIQIAIALQVIFGIAPRELFPDLYRAIEEQVINRAVEFERRLAGKAGRRGVLRRALLQSMVERSRPVPAQA